MSELIEIEIDPHDPAPLNDIMKSLSDGGYEFIGAGANGHYLPAERCIEVRNGDTLTIIVKKTYKPRRVKKILPNSINGKYRKTRTTPRSLPKKTPTYHAPRC